MVYFEKETIKITIVIPNFNKIDENEIIQNFVLESKTISDLHVFIGKRAKNIAHFWLEVMDKYLHYKKKQYRKILLFDGLFSQNIVFS